MTVKEYRILEPVAPGYLYSTGPKSVAGKARASMNALKLGLRSKKVVLPTEDAAEFDAFRQALVDDMRPVGAEETLLADTIAGLHWKMARFERAEYEVLTKEPEDKMEDTKEKMEEKPEGSAERKKVSDTPLADAILARGKELALILRYRGQALRELERARREYRLLQVERRQREAAEVERKRLAAIDGTPESVAEMLRRRIEGERQEKDVYDELKKLGDPLAEACFPPLWTFAPEWIDPEEAMAQEETLAEQMGRYEERVAAQVAEGKVTFEQAEKLKAGYAARQMAFREGGY